MDKVRQSLDDTVKRMFGASAAIDGSFGTTDQPGELRIVLDGRLIGEAATFQGALKAAMREIGLQQRREKANEPTRGLTPGTAFDVACVQ